MQDLAEGAEKLYVIRKHAGIEHLPLLHRFGTLRPPSRGPREPSDPRLATMDMLAELAAHGDDEVDEAEAAASMARFSKLLAPGNTLGFEPARKGRRVVMAGLVHFCETIPRTRTHVATIAAAGAASGGSVIPRVPRAVAARQLTASLPASRARLHPQLKGACSVASRRTWLSCSTMRCSSASGRGIY